MVLNVHEGSQLALQLDPNHGDADVGKRYVLQRPCAASHRIVKGETGRSITQTPYKHPLSCAREALSQMIHCDPQWGSGFLRAASNGSMARVSPSFPKVWAVAARRCSSVS